jgi:hypothetical protein
MHDPTDPAPETEAKPSRGLGSYVVWGFVVVMVYVLSMPPARLLVGKRIINRHLFAIYAPVGWAYLEPVPRVARMH